MLVEFQVKDGDMVSISPKHVVSVYPYHTPGYSIVSLANGHSFTVYGDRDYVVAELDKANRYK